MSTTAYERDNDLYVSPNTDEPDLEPGLECSFDVHGQKDKKKAIRAVEEYLDTIGLSLDEVTGSKWHENPDYPEVDAAAEGTYELFCVLA